MKKYRVNVNGTVYEVEIEEMSEVPSGPVFSTPAQAAHKAAVAGGEKILAPMPGNILDVRVKPGDMVRSGDVLMILEAMKMENEIMCPRDARVVSVDVKKGDAVNPDTVLCVID